MTMMRFGYVFSFSLIFCLSNSRLLLLGFLFVQNGYTVLMEVVRNGNAEIVDMLLKSGADVKITRNNVCLQYFLFNLKRPQVMIGGLLCHRENLL